ncbi:MAG TPA: hypothetical protein VGB91_05080, partial [Rhizomicrobium sp.]
MPKRRFALDPHAAPPKRAINLSVMALRYRFSAMDAKHPSSPHARFAIAALAALAAFAATAFAPQVLNDGDTFLHVAAGQRMLADHAILFRDPFSYTFGGARWDAHEWLAEIAMAWCYRAGGWSGLLSLFGAAAAIAAGLLSHALGRWLPPRAQALATVLALSCMTGTLLARPHLLALPLLVAWTASLAAARSDRRAPSLALLPLITVWANIHGSFLLGLAVAGGFALEAFFADGDDRVPERRAWLLFCAGAFAAALINPHGLDGVLFPFRLMATPALAGVGEWQPTPLTLFQPVIPVSAFTIYVIATRHVRMSLMRAAMLLGLAIMAFMHVRHQLVFAAVAPLLLAEPVAAALPRERTEGALWRPA